MQLIRIVKFGLNLSGIRTKFPRHNLMDNFSQTIPPDRVRVRFRVTLGNIVRGKLSGKILSEGIVWDRGYCPRPN